MGGVKCGKRGLWIFKKRVVGHIAKGSYTFTMHAVNSINDHEINRLDVVKALKSAGESKSEHEKIASLGWAYAFRGRLDGEYIKIIVSFEDLKGKDDKTEEEMLIINAYLLRG